MTRSVETSSELSLPTPKERRRLRESADLTHEQVAAAVGVTAATVRSWETGRTDPRGRKREAYATFLTTLAPPPPDPDPTAKGGVALDTEAGANVQAGVGALAEVGIQAGAGAELGTPHPQTELPTDAEPLAVEAESAAPHATDAAAVPPSVPSATPGSARPLTDRPAEVEPRAAEVSAVAGRPADAGLGAAEAEGVSSGAPRATPGPARPLAGRPAGAGTRPKPAAKRAARPPVALPRHDAKAPVRVGPAGLTAETDGHPGAGASDGTTGAARPAGAPSPEGPAAQGAGGGARAAEAAEPEQTPLPPVAGGSTGEPRTGDAPAVPPPIQATEPGETPGTGPTPEAEQARQCTETTEATAAKENPEAAEAAQTIKAEQAPQGTETPEAAAGKENLDAAQAGQAPQAGEGPQGPAGMGAAAGGEALEAGGQAPAGPKGAPRGGAAGEFDVLYGRAAGALVRQAYLLTGRRSLAQEAVERAFQLAWNRWPEVAADPDPVGWVRAAAHEYALSPWHQLRRAHRHPDKAPAEPADRILLDAMLALPTPHRRTVILYDGVGLDLPDTAAETEASTPTAGNRLLHAHADLAGRIPELAAVPPGQRSALLRERLATVRPAVRLEPRPAAVVRASAERRARRWTRAVVSVTAVIAAATAYTARTAPTQYEPPIAPGASVSGVPPHSGPQRLTEESRALHDKLRADPAAGPARLAPKVE
ncbi:helix-turn-helix domain-containing protein [Streptomyces sp. NPDC057011]|uniref:helix-turn-helix domain-containing protein n=1 Tax=unclassified Streptomyces TaxID=2593676 RepID=UPI00362CD762